MSEPTYLPPVMTAADLRYLKELEDARRMIQDQMQLQFRQPRFLDIGFVYAPYVPTKIPRRIAKAGKTLSGYTDSRRTRRPL